MQRQVSAQHGVPKIVTKEWDGVNWLYQQAQVQQDSCGSWHCLVGRVAPDITCIVPSAVLAEPLPSAEQQQQQLETAEQQAQLCREHAQLLDALRALTAALTASAGGWSFLLSAKDGLAALAAAVCPSRQVSLAAMGVLYGECCSVQGMQQKQWPCSPR